jgi:hypothetical protein
VAKAVALPELIQETIPTGARFVAQVLYDLSFVKTPSGRHRDHRTA